MNFSITGLVLLFSVNAYAYYMNHNGKWAVFGVFS